MRRILLLALVASVLVAIPSAATAKSHKVDVCHDGDNGWELITVSGNGGAVDALIARGGALPGDPVPDMDGYSFDDACVPVADEVVFAVAYTDVVDDGGLYDADVDVLISKLVDDNGDGVPSAGDAIITDQYPTNLAGTAFGAFGVKQTAVTSIVTGGAFCQAVGADGSLYEWADAFDQEKYSEMGGLLNLVDSYDTDADVILVLLGSPSMPDTAVFPLVFRFSAGDDPFLDIDLNCQS